MQLNLLGKIFLGAVAVNVVKKVVDHVTEDSGSSNELQIVQQYYNSLSPGTLSLIPFVQANNWLGFNQKFDTIWGSKYTYDNRCVVWKNLRKVVLYM